MIASLRSVSRPEILSPRRKNTHPLCSKISILSPSTESIFLRTHDGIPLSCPRMSVTEPIGNLSKSNLCFLKEVEAFKGSIRNNLEPELASAL